MVVEAAFDRKVQDVGNILMMEHVNVLVPNQQLAQVFYISGLGLTRDPYMMVGQDNMWANAGKQQFHLPTRGMQVVRGEIGIEVPDIEALKSRLEANQAPAGGYQVRLLGRGRRGPRHLPVGQQVPLHGRRGRRQRVPGRHPLCRISTFPLAPPRASRGSTAR